MLSLSKKLEKLLNDETGERKAVQFFAKHPQLLRDHFISTRGHCQYVLTEVSLAGEYFIDAVVKVATPEAFRTAMKGEIQ